LWGGSNLFAYAPNPLGWVDPFGLTSKENKPECPCSGGDGEDVTKGADDLVTVRHHTNTAGLKGIKSDGAIKPGRSAGMDTNVGVYIEVNPVGPIKLTPKDVGATYGG
jgi:hypothetical protein